jgi:hypothetical protein
LRSTRDVESDDRIVWGFKIELELEGEEALRFMFNSLPPEELEALIEEYS